MVNHNLGDSLLPGANNALPGYDPYYETKPLRKPQTVPTDGSSSDGQSEIAINAGETRQFTLVMNNVLAAGVYGVGVMAPGDVKGGSALILGVGHNGTVRSRAIAEASDFNHPIGRFNSGMIVVIGTVENGPTPGLLKIVYGPPETQADLGDGGAAASAEIVHGNATITLPKAGAYVVTYLVEVTTP